VKRRLWKFPGGIRLPGFKAMSLNLPLARADLPKRLVLPLRQHIGAPAEPVVEVGQSVRKGEVIAQANGYISAPVHAPSSGRIVNIGDYPVPHPSGLTAPCIEIETDGEDRWMDGAETDANPEGLSVDELRTRIRAAGIVGLGGAVFPSAVKLTPVPERPIDTLVLNGVECEPYITCDDVLMRTRAADVVRGAQVLQRLVGAGRCVIGVEANKPEAAEALRQAVTHTRADAVDVVVVPTVFPAGGEKQLIKVVTGREVPRHGLPAQVGVVCLNVATAVAVLDAVAHTRPLIERIVTVTGPGVRQPRNFVARIGTPVAALVAQAGGYAVESPRLIMGGPMMGVELANDDLPVTKATNCVLVEAPPARAPRPALPCIRCGSCATACPVRLLPQQLYWYAQSAQFDKAEDYAVFDCIECGCCAHVCPSNIPLVSYFRFAKTELAAAERDRRKAERSRQRHEMHQQRLEREQAARAQRRKRPARAAA
jgi:Na+-translocating ferredoxin:NAD+ oxidoreductase subunit C